MIERQILRYLEAMRSRGEFALEVESWTGARVALADSPKVRIRLAGPAAARHLMKPSLDSLGEAFVEGEIEVDGAMRDVIEIASALAASEDTTQGKGRLPNWFTRHSRRSDRSAIEYHYDVSNEFYAMWLDPQMVDSCAYFPTGSEDLAAAQVAKLDHVCRKLRISPGDRLLDIGCGWGALALHAASRYGARVVGITLSQNQFRLASERVAAAGLTERIEIRLQDYRDVPRTERFDRISSIGMFEHVGLKNLGEYFRIVHDLLRPGGVALNHGITSSDTESRSVGLGAGDFIDRYVFPEGELPHVSLAIRELSAAKLELTDAESLRRHYARTLWTWSDAFERHLPRLTELAGARRARIWRAYLAGCAYAFQNSWINIYQLLAVRPGASDDDFPLPLSRAYMYPTPSTEGRADPA